MNGCLTTSLIYHAAAKGIKIDEVESILAGDVDLHSFGLNENIRNRYEKIQVAFKIKSDASEEKLRELVELAQKRSPVFDIISHPTPSSRSQYGKEEIRSLTRLSTTDLLLLVKFHFLFLLSLRVKNSTILYHYYS